MARIFTYMILAVGLTLLLKFSGLPAGADGILTWAGISTNASGLGLGAFFTAVMYLFTAGAVAGIVIGFFTKSSTESTLVATLAIGLLSVVTGTFISIINYTKDMGWIYYLVFMVFILFTIGFMESLISWWRGTD